MATLFLKAAGGNSNAAATWSNVSSSGVDNSGPPTAADNCIADSNSGQLTVNATLAMRSFDCQSANGAAVGTYANTITHTANVTWTVGDATAGAGNIAFRLSAGCTYTVTATRQLNFASTSATQQTINTAGKTMQTVTTGTVAGTPSYILGGAFTTTVPFELRRGTFDTGSFNMSMTQFQSDAGNTRTLTLGSSVITCTSTGQSMLFAAPGLTVTANTATFTCSGAGTTITGAGVDFNGATLNLTGGGALTMTGSNKFGALLYPGTAASGGSLTLDALATTTITGAFTPTGNNSQNRILVTSATAGTAHTISAGSSVPVDVDFRDIAGAGAAAPFAGTRVGNSQGCTNITFAGATNKFLVSGNANTVYATSNHFAATTGGATAVTNYPLPQDTLKIDTNTGWTAGPRSMATAVTQRHPSLDASAMTQNWTNGGTPNGWYTWGTVVLSTSKTTTFNSANVGFQFLPRSAGQCHITPGLLDSASYVSTSGVNSGSVVFDAATTTGLSLLANGNSTIDGGGFNHTFGSCAPFGTSGFTLGTGTWTVNTLFGSTLVSVATNWSMASGKIVMAGTSTNFSIGPTVSLGTLEFAAGATLCNLAGLFASSSTLTVGTVKINPARALQWDVSHKLTIAFTVLLDAVGSAGNLITVTTSSAGTAVTMFTKTSGNVCVDWWSIKDSTVSGGATFSAGTNSTNVSGNTGWVFTACPQTTQTVTDAEGAVDSELSTAVAGVTADAEGGTDSTVDTVAATMATDANGVTDSAATSGGAAAVDMEGGTDSETNALGATVVDLEGGADSSTSDVSSTIADAEGALDDLEGEGATPVSDVSGLSDSVLAAVDAIVADISGLLDDADVVRHIGDVVVSDVVGGLDDTTIAAVLLASEALDGVDLLANLVASQVADDLALDDEAIVSFVLDVLIDCLHVDVTAATVGIDVDPAIEVDSASTATVTIDDVAATVGIDVATWTVEVEVEEC